MSAGDINIAAKKNNKKSRRRKKRRTEDFSDSSSSSDSSDNEMNTVDDVDVEMGEVQAEEEENKNIEENLIMKNVVENEKLNEEIRDKLDNIPFTKTKLVERNKHNEILNLQKVEDTINSAKENVNALNNDASNNNKNITTTTIGSADKNEYLSLLFKNYGDDINELRNAPDFSSNSLILLANVLKDGTGMFDEDTLKTILRD